MSSGAGLGQVQLGMERDMISPPRDSHGVLGHSWAMWKAPITLAGCYRGFMAGPWDLPHL